MPGADGDCRWDGLGDLGSRLIEVEEFVETDGRMNTAGRVEAGLRVLGAMHSALRDVATSDASVAPPFVNYVAPGAIIEATRRGTSRIRSWNPTTDEVRLADAADELAIALSAAYAALDRASIQRQLVHGDFWDNNVLYRGDEIALIHDFDHMGVRDRIDDVGLTAYFLNAEDTPDADGRRRTLRRLVDAYDSGLAQPLSAAERMAMPIALARQPLWSVGGWIADLDDEGAAREHARGLLPEVEFALKIMDALPGWQATMA